jgi:hypothetical protein
MASTSDLLNDLARETVLRKKWAKIWDKIGQRILQMPKWMQEIILEDINTAILNRLAVMELIQKSKRLKDDV